MRYKLFFISFIACLLLGCMNSNQAIIVAEVDLNNANEVILLLGNNQIQSNLVPAKDQTYSVTVSDTDKINALQIMQQNGKPDHSYTSMGAVFKKDGFISSPLEEHGRLVYALDQEISHMISMINGVVDVNVQVSIPVPDDKLYSSQDALPSASVLVKYKQGQRVDLYVNRIKNLVSGAVPGLSADHVTVVAMEQKN